MTDVNFDGDVDGLSEKQLSFISDAFVKHGYKGAKVTVTPVGDSGDNYTASVKRFVAEKDGKVFKMIVKIASPIPQVRMKSHTLESFKNEDIMYNEVLPLFTKLEKEAGIPDNDRFRYAACYGTLMDENEELCLLEDLTVSQYVMLDRFKSLTDNEIKLILKEFARLHALSYVLKKKDMDVFNNFKPRLINTWDRLLETPEAHTFFQMGEKQLGALLDNDKYKKSLEGTMSKLLDYIQKLSEEENNSRFSVIQQGDPWTNNIMFRLEEGKAVKCCMIDYQLSKVNNPAADLHYMLFNCTDHKTIVYHYHDWIDFYHTQLGKNLSLFGLKVDILYPKEQLDKDMKRHGKWSFAISLLLTSVFMREGSEAEKLKQSFAKDDMAATNNSASISQLGGRSLGLMKAKIEGLVDSYHELGFL